MKKILCVCLVAILSISIVSCRYDTETEFSDGNIIASETEESAVDHVINLIRELKHHDTSDIGMLMVKNAGNAYGQLSSAEKEMVSSSSVSRLLDEMYYRIKSECVAKIEKSLKQKLKNPDSLQIHSSTCTVYVDTNNYRLPVYAYIRIDYSAQNGFGGYNRDDYTEYYRIDDDGYLGLGSYDGCQKIRSEEGIEAEYVF